MVVRKAVASDAPKIAEVNIDTWRTAYQGIIPAQHLAKLSYKKKEKLVRDIITAGDNRFILVAELETGEITGFTGAGPERNLEMASLMGAIWSKAGPDHSVPQ